MHNDIASAVSGLSPMARWNLSLNAAIVAMAWAFADVAWAAWPTPMRCAAWFWLVTTLLSPVYIIVANYVVSKSVFASLAQAEKQDDGAGPTVAPPSPEAPQAPPP